jgi:hypothetical protein
MENGKLEQVPGYLFGSSMSSNQLALQSDGTPWVGGFDGLGKVENGSFIQVTKHSPNGWHVSSLAAGPDDWVWCGHDSSLVKTNGTDWFTYDASNTNFPGSRINCLHFDKTGTLWAGGYRWAGTFDGVSTWTVYDSTDCAYLRDTSVQDLLVEDDGTLWLGTDKHGLLKFDGVTWTQYDVIPPSTGIEEEQPAEIELSPAYPNPFNPITTIGFSLPEPGPVNLAVYDVTGEKVATLIDGEISAGRHEITFDGIGLASGLYFYRIQTGNFAKTGKMLLMK